MPQSTSLSNECKSTSIIYKQTGNLRAVQILLGHTKIESTVRYLGVDIEGALALAEGTEV
jgi:site-specific recombinase XerC